MIATQSVRRNDTRGRNDERRKCTHQLIIDRLLVYTGLE